MARYPALSYCLGYANVAGADDTPSLFIQNTRVNSSICGATMVVRVTAWRSYLTIYAVVFYKAGRLTSSPWRHSVQWRRQHPAGRPLSFLRPTLSFALPPLGGGLPVLYTIAVIRHPPLCPRYILLHGDPGVSMGSAASRVLLTRQSRPPFLSFQSSVASTTTRSQG